MLEGLKKNWSWIFRCCQKLTTAAHSIKWLIQLWQKYNFVCLLFFLAKISFCGRMWLSFLLFIAAVPLLGEAQIKREKNEEKRKKIRKEESLSSCHTATTYKRSPLLIDLPKSANLYGQPGTRHRIPVRLSNIGSLRSHLLISHQEAFPVHSLHTPATHVELVSGIQPAEVELAAQSSVTVHILITVSSYVPPLYRSKVTVSARPLVSNQTEEDHHRRHADVSFYFTVVHPGATLTDYDLTPPTCNLLCIDQCRPGDCQGWTARVKNSSQNQSKSLFVSMLGLKSVLR